MTILPEVIELIVGYARTKSGARMFQKPHFLHVIGGWSEKSGITENE